MVCEYARHRGRNVPTGATQVGRLPIFHAMDLDGRARLASVLRPCYFHAGGEVWALLSLQMPPQLRTHAHALARGRTGADANARAHTQIYDALDAATELYWVISGEV